MKPKHSLPSWISQRAAGSLLHLSSLPGSYGIGNLGSGGAVFRDFGLLGNPLLANLPGWPDSGTAIPLLQVFSSFAGNPYFIDWDP